VGFSDAIQSGLANYTNFSGRSSRSAYWWWVLFTSLLSLVAQALDAWLRPGGMGTPSYAGIAIGLITGIVGVALIVPSLAVLVRRLHDTDRSGWWWLIAVIPVIGWLVLLYFLVSPGTPGENRFGRPSFGAFGSEALVSA
jgi:uncharacterized membrane protein YhaH (DUF805 family)